MRFRPLLALCALTLIATGCSAAASTPAPTHRRDSLPEFVAALDTAITATIDATGIAEPLAQATLSTRLMAGVTDVLVHEGDVVRRGDMLIQLDTRDLAAKDEQTRGALAAAESQADDAERNAQRIRALYVDSAAPRALLDAAEARVTQVQAAVTQARAAQREVAANAGYAAVRAPFDGVVTHRFVDPGAFAAPGAPLVTVQDRSQLRVVVTTTPEVARTITRGTVIDSRIESDAATARVEGVVPATRGALYTINALVINRDGRYASGGAAVLRLPAGTRRAVLVPRIALVQQGDLAGVHVLVDGTPTLRWVRLGAAHGDRVEVLSGLQCGERVVVMRAGGET